LNVARSFKSNHGWRHKFFKIQEKSSKKFEPFGRPGCLKYWSNNFVKPLFDIRHTICEIRKMNERKEHFDEDSDLRISSKLSADLKALFQPQVGVPPEVDRAVMDRVHKHFAPLQSGKSWHRRIHWAWRIAAAAAVIILAFSLDLTKQPEPTAYRYALSEIQATDIDRNGRVDILDAFKLAKQIETSGPAQTEWDINGDGLIDRSDVDVVALAAVRLDKGVL